MKPFAKFVLDDFAGMNGVGCLTLKSEIVNSSIVCEYIHDYCKFVNVIC